jgi:hypothetical protein
LGRPADCGEEPANQRRGAKHFGRADAEHHLAHRDEPLETQLEPDREQQQDDSELGEGFDPPGVGDRDRFQPFVAADQRAKTERTGNDPDQDEPDHRVDPEPGERRDDDPRRAEDGQRIGQGRGQVEFAGHRLLKAWPAGLVTWSRTHLGALSAGQEVCMAKSFSKGDKVEWDSSGGHSVGKVVRKVTATTHIKGHKVAASKDNPEYIVESDKSGKRAAHKPKALKKA